MAKKKKSSAALPEKDEFKQINFTSLAMSKVIPELKKLQDIQNSMHTFINGWLAGMGISPSAFYLSKDNKSVMVKEKEK